MRIRRTSGNIPLLLFGLLIIALGFGILFKEHSIFASAISADENTTSEVENDEHFITIHDNGNASITIRSDAMKVSDAIERAGIEINSGDIVEPGLDENISDNDYFINIYRAKDVVVSDGSTKKVLRTAASSPEEIAKEAGIKLLQADEVELKSSNNILESGTVTAYTVKRAKEVKLNYYGKMISIRTQAKTVSDLLKSQDISNNKEENWVSEKLDTKISDGMSFEVMRQGKHTMVQEETIAYSTRTTTDFDLDYGARKVTQVGQTGTKEVTYEVDMKDGKEISRQFISEVVTKEPVEEHVTVGGKVNLPAGSHEDWMAQAGISPSDYGYVEFIISHESGWGYMKYNYSGSGAYGLCQALPGSKMASAGADWQTNPITQLRWCNGYAVGRYGSWAGAYSFWISHHWW